MSLRDPKSLIIFIRRPELGKVKTRLAAGVGDQRALDIYKELLDHTRKVSLAVNCTRQLWYTNRVDDDDKWSADDFEKNVQVDGDLGQRMKAAFAKAITTHDKSIIIGSDCPQLSKEIVASAFEALDKHDVVIGPTFDGGYYLLGMKTLHPYLFDDMAWSTEDVFESTVSRIKSRDLSYALLDQLSDVDYQEDWEKYGWEI